MTLSRNIARRARVAAVLGALALAACSRRAGQPVREPAVSLPLRVLADSGESAPFAVPPTDRARAWLQRVSRADPRRRSDGAVAPAPPGALDLPPPEAFPEVPASHDEMADALVVDEGLRPPVPRGAAPIQPPRARGRVILVDLDVRVDEAGEVTDALWAGASRDSAALAAATACALAQHFHPALQRGLPVAVWCRQRFEFGRAGARPVTGNPDPASDDEAAGN